MATTATVTTRYDVVRETSFPRSHSPYRSTATAMEIGMVTAPMPSPTSSRPTSRTHSAVAAAETSDPTTKRELTT